jgi:hypothetical protein
MPVDTPRANVVECEQTGAHVTLMKGLITDCGAEVARRKDSEGWCRVEGTQVPPLIEPDGRISRIRLSEVVRRNGYRFHATVVGIVQS